MKITMLGTSGSGKTVYMSAMAELFLNSSVDGYTLENRGSDFRSSTFVAKTIAKTNTLYTNGSFPSGTATSVLMPLELRYRGNSIIDIDWIDYRGEALNELVTGVENEQTAEILATLLASDVILVFVDAAVLKECRNLSIARANVGANTISRLLNMVSKTKRLDIIFLLSKIDSSTIDIKKDFSALKTKIGQIYSHFFTDTNTDVSNYAVMAVGALGVGNVETTHKWISNSQGGQQLTSRHAIKNYQDLEPVGVAASFARALLKCLDSEINNLNTEASKLAKELNRLKSNFGPIKNLLDLLFNNSRKREIIFDLEQKILDSRRQILKLEPHKIRLEKIATGLK